MRWTRRLYNCFRPARLRTDLERELAFHIREAEDDLLASGLSRAEAARQARLRFGSMATHIEGTQEMDINLLLDSCARNLRLAVRGLARTPVFTAAVILTLALGTGVNSAVFSVIDAVLLRPLPFPESERLVVVQQLDRKRPDPQVAPARLLDWNRLNTTFVAISGAYLEDVSELSGELPERYRRAFLAPRYLEVLGVFPAIGRDFNSLEEKWGGPSAALISNRLWRRRFNSDPNVAGRTLRIGNASVPVIGVMPAGFGFPDRDVDIWSATTMDAPFARARTLNWFRSVGRIKPGVSVAQARENLIAVQANLGRQFPVPDADISVSVTPLMESTVGGAKRSLWLVFGAVSLLLLLACANVASLLLSRASSREQEIAVRFSLGATKVAVAAQLLTEVFVLAVAGSTLGLVLAAGASRILSGLAKDLPRLDEVGLDWRIVLYAVACALATTLLCGLLPAMRATGRPLAGVMQQAGRARIGGRNRAQMVLTGVQVALAVTLLAGAGLMIRSFQELGRVAPGFDPEGVLTFRMSNSWSESGDRKALAQRLNRVLEGLRTIPGVSSAASTITLPGVPMEYQVEVAPVEGPQDASRKMLVQSRFVTPEYFKTMRIPLIEGEACRDDPGVATMVVNRAFVRAYVPERQRATGLHLRQPANAYVPAAEIRGVTGDAREAGLDREPVPTAYWCGAALQPNSYFVVRTAGDPAAQINSVRRKIQEIEPRRSVYDLMPLRDRIADSYEQTRMRTVLLGFFALTAVSLACVGLYGTLSYLVQVRRKEVGVRIALGALPGQIIRDFLSQGLWVAGLGSAGGLALAAATSRILDGMLYGVAASDPATVAGVLALVLIVSALASLVPALRAARLEPVRALRDE